MSLETTARALQPIGQADGIGGYAGPCSCEKSLCWSPGRWNMFEECCKHDIYSFRGPNRQPPLPIYAPDVAKPRKDAATLALHGVRDPTDPAALRQQRTVVPGGAVEAAACRTDGQIRWPDRLHSGAG